MDLFSSFLFVCFFFLTRLTQNIVIVVISREQNCMLKIAKSQYVMAVVIKIDKNLLLAKFLLYTMYVQVTTAHYLFRSVQRVQR